MGATSALEGGRESYAGQAWAAAYESLTVADRADALGPQDLELLARSAYMLGRDDDYVAGLERAHHAHLEAGDVQHAVRCAFWIGHNWLFRGETGRATGWFNRGQRLLDQSGEDSVEAGYMLIPVWLRQMARADYEAGYATAGRGAEIGERFGDVDLVCLARDEQGRALVHQGRAEEGLRLVDEVLVAATAGELSPIVTGIVYCNTIAFCQDAFELRHAREWTQALTQWCERQPEMVAHNGLCLVHRAEIMQLRGTWTEAMKEARRAAERFTSGALNQIACGKAFYRQGEIHRLRGELDLAADAYREASSNGFDPQPGRALLRLSQGDVEAAVAAIQRAIAESPQPLQRAALLPAYVEIMLTAGDDARAVSACRELEEIAESSASDVLAALSAHARGQVTLAGGDPATALGFLRQAWHSWQELEAPHEAARVRVLVALACRALGDEDTALLELSAARSELERLTATPDVARVDSLMRRP
ncbi:MAG TPA: DNA-binding response regulator, partial [Pedococcus sp.]|nr:DNA-binding response regulator [Pedococcus sp.]